MPTYAIGDIHGCLKPLDELPAVLRPRLHRGAVDAGTTALPFEVFFDAVPAAHRRFLEGLAHCCRTPDCVCTHAGVHPSIADLDRQGRVLTWSHDAFPTTTAATPSWSTAVGLPGPEILQSAR